MKDIVSQAHAGIAFKWGMYPIISSADSMFNHHVYCLIHSTEM